MAGRILVCVFWVVGAGLIGYAIANGGWTLLVPAAVLVALALFGLDLALHRKLVAFDWPLLRTLLHLLSAVAVAATCMYWLGVVILRRGG
jgi:hypothetical protein